MPLIPDRWARVRFRYVGPYVRVRLEDDRGQQLLVHWNWSETPIDERALDPLRKRIAELARELPEFRPGPHGGGSVPLAVFLELPVFLWPDQKPRQRLTAALVDPDLAGRVQFVLSSPRLRAIRVPFSLPLDIVTVGSAAADAVSPLRDAWWAQQADISGFGLRVTDIVETDSDALEATLRARERDIVVTSDLQSALAVCATVTTDARPRLIIAIDPSAEPVPPPAGTALVLLRGGVAAEERVGDILYGFVHDYPIHEAVAVALRRPPFIVDADIVADPVSNQSLRMRDALIQLSTTAQEIELTLPSAPLGPVIRSWQIKLEKPAASPPWWRRLVTRWIRRREDVAKGPPIDYGYTESYSGGLASLRRDAIQMRIDPVSYDLFTQESTGLVPMTHTSMALERINSEATELIASVHAMTNDRQLLDIAADCQNRVIDVAMQRMETEPFLSFVQPSNTLQAGAMYRLRVHVGNRAQDSLVTGPDVPIDPLLPLSDPDARQLDIVIQPKDFTVVTAVQKPLRLPRLGASLPVYFRVRAPEAPGVASLRVHAYYKNHLVQSFLFQAQIESQEGAAAEPPTHASLVYTRVERLVVDEVQPRALSIAINSNGSSTHGLEFKSDGAAGELLLPVGRYTKPLDDYRGALDYAARDTRLDSGKVYPELPAGAPVPEDVAEIVRALARVGRNLYVAFLGNADEVKGMRDRLELLKGQSDEKVQVVRFDASFVVPWTLLYDRWWPDADWKKAQVCLGVVRDANGKTTPCTHTETSEVICARGFWGIRLYVEELIGRGSDKHVTVPRPASGAVRFVCGDDTLTGGSTLEKELKKFVASASLALGPAESKPLLELLWRTPPERPSILIVLGHVESAGPLGDYPRVVLTPRKEWLTYDGIANRAIGPKWGQPRSIVMLMGCESATTAPDTVNNFVTTLWLAGAAAVIGTEAVIADKVAAKGAERLTQLLWSDKKSLGEAMTTLRRELLAAGSPLAFVFNAVGSVDVALDAGASS